MTNFTTLADVVFNDLAKRAAEFQRKGFSNPWQWAAMEAGLDRWLGQGVQWRADELGIIPE